MQKQKYTKFYASIGVLVLCAVALVAIPLIRSPDAQYIGEDAYFNLRMAESLGWEDTLSYGGRFAAYSFGLPVVLSLNPHLLSVLLPFILGILSLLIFRYILKDLGVEHDKLTLVILIASPTFIYTFSTLNRYMFPIFLSLLGFWLMLRKKRSAALSIPLFAIIPLFNLPLGLMALFLLFLLTRYKDKEKLMIFYSILFATIFVGALYYGFMMRKVGFGALDFIARATGTNAKLQVIFSDLGGIFGMGIFSFVLAAMGIMSVWKNKYKDLFVFFSVFTLLILIFFRAEALFLLNFFIAAFSAKGMMYLWTKRWESKTIKQILIFTLACGLLFSLVSSSTRLVSSFPDEGIMRGVNRLESLPDGAVFSHYSRGHLITYAGKVNVMDSNFHFAPDVNQRWEDSNKLFYTRDWKVAESIITKYDIKYIWIDSEMKNSLWKAEDEGLLFLLKYSPAMQNIYDNGDIEIWQIKEAS